MDTGTVGYIVMGAVAVGGIIAFAAAMTRGRHRAATRSFVVLIIGVVGLLFWTMFLGTLKVSLAEAVIEGRDAEQRHDVDVRFAAARGQPKPEPQEEDALAMKAMKHAMRTARKFGWSEEELKDAYYPDGAAAQPGLAGDEPRP